MELSLNLSYADGYKSRSQIARVITETWVSQNAYCPHCGCGTLVKYVNNSPVLDFHCPICKQGFELKSKSGKYGRKIVDGEYSTMISRITSSTNPDFFFLNYQLDTNRVTDFLLIPKQFITESIIEKRQPLSASARRAGWTGCNILVERIPTDGRIFIVKDSVVCQKDDVLSKLRERETEFLHGLILINEDGLSISCDVSTLLIMMNLDFLSYMSLRKNYSLFIQITIMYKQK